MTELISSPSGAEKSESHALVERNRETGFVDLPERDKMFVVEWLTNGFKHREAAIAVGLAPDGAFRKLRDPLVQGFIQFLQETRYRTRLITQDFVEQHYLQLIPKLMGEEEIAAIDSEGNQISVKKFHSAEMVSVLRDLGKAAGYVPTAVGDGGKVSVTINMGDFTGADPPAPKSVTVDVTATRLDPPEEADPNRFPAFEVEE